MFVGGFGGLVLYFAPDPMVGQPLPRWSETDVGDHAAFLRQGFQGDHPAVEDNVEPGIVMVPAEFLYEQQAEIKSLEQLSDADGIQFHGQNPKDEGGRMKDEANRSCIISIVLLHSLQRLRE